jgi:hypothetical protein
MKKLLPKDCKQIGATPKEILPVAEVYREADM